jgi:hypothetical protein
MKKTSTFLKLITGMVFLASATSSAYAEHLNLFAGSNVGSNESGLAAAELTMPFVVEVGPFFEWSRNTAAGTENRYFVGAVGRVPVPFLGFFGDVRVGYNWNSSPVNVSGRDGFMLEPGVGYRFSTPVVDIMPRVGFNAVTSNSDLPTVNLSIGVGIPL